MSKLSWRFLKEPGWPYQFLAHVTTVLLGVALIVIAPGPNWIVLGVWFILGGVLAGLGVLASHGGLESVGLYLLVVGYLLSSGVFFLVWADNGTWFEDMVDGPVYLICGITLLIPAFKGMYRLNVHKKARHQAAQLRKLDP